MDLSRLKHTAVDSLFLIRFEIILVNTLDFFLPFKNGIFSDDC